MPWIWCPLAVRVHDVSILKICIARWVIHLLEKISMDTPLNKQIVTTIFSCLPIKYNYASNTNWSSPSRPGIKRGPAASLLQDLQDGDYLLSHLRSTIGVTKLNFSVRNGKRWNLRAIVTWISFYVFMTHKQAIPALSSKLKVYIIHPYFKESERAISNARLWCLHLYTCILSTSSSLTTLRNLILWPASYLDAFSTYPIPT